MKLKSQQYWAIVITLLFHVVVFWILFFVEMKKSQKIGLYELELDAKKVTEIEKKKKKDKEEVDKIAEQQLNEMLTSRAVKRAVGNEKIEQSSESKEEFHQEQKQIKVLQAPKKLPQISLSKKEDKGTKIVDTIDKKQTVFYVGKSRVEYFLAERYRVKLPVPVYQCEGAGTVQIAIYVNRKGSVVNAEVIKEGSRSATNCMREAALQAALSSVFGKRPQAPYVQKGRIVYMFAAQGN